MRIDCRATRVKVVMTPTAKNVDISIFMLGASLFLANARNFKDAR